MMPAPSEVRFAGVERVIGGITFVIPPMAVGTIIKFEDRLKKFGVDGSHDLSLVLDLLHACLKRNYPDLTKEDVGEILDLGSALEVMHTMMASSGLLGDGTQGNVQGASTGAPV